MGPIAPPCGRPQIVNLTIENRRRELAVRIDRRAFPQEQPLERQLRMVRVAVRTRGVRIAITRLVQCVDDGRRELPAWVREVIDRLAKPGLEDPLRSLNLV